MVHRQSLIPVPGLRRVGLDPQQPEPNLFLVAGWWQAACPSCGFTLVEGRRQSKVERQARGVACPVCVEVA
jgi:hypothetical protein